MSMGFGILGAGMISGCHADALRNSGVADLVAVADVDADRAAKLAAEYAPDAKSYGGLDEMLGDERVEAVSIVTPNHLHHDAVIACAKAGKHVLCEKPPAMSLKETDAMIAACEAAGVEFGIFVQCRVRKPIVQMKKAIDDGRFGKILRADATMKWFREAAYYQADPWRSKRQCGAGVTVQHAFHYIDLLQHLMGPAALVDGKMSNLAHPDVELEDTLDARLEFANGAMGNVQASTAMWPGTDVTIEIFGTKGAAVMVGAAFTLWQFRDEQPEDAGIRDVGDAGQMTAGSDPKAVASIDHQMVVDDLVAAVAEDREVVIPCSAVRPSLEIALALYKSDKLGASVALPLTEEESIWA